MGLKQIKKQDFANFLAFLQKEYNLIAPIRKKDTIVYDTVKDISKVEVVDKPAFSARKVFLPNSEIIFKYQKNRIMEEKHQQTLPSVLITHPCDANAIAIIDRVYLDDQKDVYYKKRRENSILLVFECLKPMENCFCDSLGTDKTNNYDLLFNDKGDRYLVNVRTEKGELLTINKFFTNVMGEMSKKESCKKKMIMPLDLNKLIKSPKWGEESKKCLFCNGCIIVCPTCYCYDVQDVPNLDIISGERKRYWDFCYMQEYSRVAGGFVFRKDKASRFKHRILHKLLYFKERYGVHLCVGCGRCISICPKKIDMVNIINSLESHPSIEQKQTKPAEDIEKAEIIIESKKEENQKSSPKKSKSKTAKKSKKR